MLRPFDLYSALINAPKGILKGTYASNGIILYGRVNERMIPIPDVILANHQETIENHGYSVYSFDIFAYQEKDTVYAADGRIAVLLNGNFPQHSVTCISCKLYYLRNSTGALSLENNMVLGCFFDYIDQVFKIKPAELVPTESMAIADEDKQTFIDNLVTPNEFKSAMFPYPARLGTECPLLAGRAVPLPSFYSTQGDSLSFIRSLVQLRNMLPDVHLAENYSDWTVTSNLEQYLNTSAVTTQPNVQHSRVYFPPKDSPEILNAIRQAFISANDRISEDFELINSSECDEALVNTLCDTILDYIAGTYSVSTFGKTGKVRFKQMLKIMLRNSGSALRGAEDEIDALINPLSFQEIRETLYTTCPNPVRKLKDWVVDQHISNIKVHTIFAFAWAVLGIRSTYYRIFRLHAAENAVDLLMHNPYRLTIVCPNLSLDALDKLACFAGVAMNLANLSFRAIACVHNALLTDNDNSIVFHKNRLRFNAGYSLNRRDIENYRGSGSLLNEDQINLARILQPAADCSLPRGLIESQGYGGTLNLDFQNIEKSWVVQQYIHSGFGITFDFRGLPYVMDYEHAAMLVSVCDYFLSSQEQLESLPDDVISDCIASFERAKGFTLEEEQKEVSKLLDYSHGSLVGPAGSGKTTSLELLIKLLTKQNPDVNIALAAPTGMAARRMTECTGRQAKTLHSLLQLGDTEFSYGYAIKALGPDDGFSPDVLIIDESSMLSLNLMYYVIQRCAQVHPRIILVGDVSQLPPIDCGKPFMDLLHFLPCVKLSVSKRAAEGSAITRNSNLFNQGDVSGLRSGTDMQLINLPDDSQFVGLCTNIADYYLGNTPGLPYGVPEVCPGEHFDPSDIQFISPVAKSSYAWSTTALNTALQNVFNPATRGQFGIAYSGPDNAVVNIRIGDRVINSHNNYGQYRYHYLDDTQTALEAFDVGIVNGDIGYVRRICFGRDISWYTSIKVAGGMVHEVPLQEDDITTRGWNEHEYGMNKLCVLVEFKDSAGFPYLVAFKADTRDRITRNTSVTPSPALQGISLAYAITAHKMQGSQAKLIITPIYKCASKNFISKNLVYTTWTRAQKGLYVIGDITNNGASALSLAKNINALALRVTPFDIERNS